MAETELSNRKKAVLEAVVKAYIETGEPVGSKILTSLLENAPSSATLRNEMNELCALGLLSQPHTSAGRVPTSSGYRLYINSLMKPSAIGESAKRFLDSSFLSVGGDIREIPIAVAKVISNLTGFPTVVSFMADSSVYLKKAELMPISSKSAVLLAVTSDGRTDNRLCNIPSGLTDELILSFKDIVGKKLRRRALDDFDRAYLQSITAAQGINSLELIPIIAELFSMMSDINASTVSIKGRSNLYDLFGEQQARRILSLSGRRDALISVLEGAEDQQVIFGNDTGLSELQDKALVVSKYSINNRYCGKIGIIGPGRMSYEQIIPSIEYAATKLSEMLTNAVKDMED